MECLVILALGLFFSAPPVEEVRQATTDAYREGGFQARIPAGDKAVVVDTPLSERLDPPSAGSSAVSALLWILIAVGIAVAALYLAQRLGGYTADIEAHRAARAGAAAVRAPPPADEARRLAAEGRYEEAIHLLLLLALHPLAQQRHLAGSLTSREVIRSVELPDAARDAVEGLRLAVEISVFGGLPPTRAEFDACVRHFDRYCSALGVEAA